MVATAGGFSAGALWLSQSQSQSQSRAVTVPELVTHLATGGYGLPSSATTSGSLLALVLCWVSRGATVPELVPYLANGGYGLPSSATAGA